MSDDPSFCFQPEAVPVSAKSKLLAENMKNHIKTVDEHLRELGPLEAKRHVPGSSVPNELREFRYVEDDQKEPFELVFRRLARHVDPPLMTDGGALIEGCVVTLPTGQRFQAISYRGDISGWRDQVTRGAAGIGRSLARIDGDKLALDNGTSHSLGQCQIEFD